MLASLGLRGDQLVEQADRAYLGYANLCAAKHGNPTLLAEFGVFERGEQRLWVPPGPVPMPEAERVTVYAISTTVLVAGWAIASVLRHHVPAAHGEELKPWFAAIGRARQDLETFMAEREWDRDSWQQWRLPSTKKQPAMKQKKKRAR